jgi:Rrf2 family protein
MHLSARGQYGVRAVIALACSYQRGPLPLREIVRTQETPPSYLEQILRTLRQAGLVVATRGAHGGYRLARAPQDITVGQVIRALDGPIAPVACVSEGQPAACEQAAICPSRRAWLRLRDGIAAALDGTTIAELIDGRTP